ncbi:HAUS1 protein, partial [Climacteris rufus]|nr:HAUS1 protein [Climacteris rufus]
QVTIWLKKIFGDLPVPKYEVNEKTVDILHEMMKFNEERDKDATLLIEDMKEQAAKYEEETDYWQSILLEGLGLSLSSLSPEATMVADELVESAMILKAKDTSLTSFYCAINNRSWEMFEKTSENKEMEQELKNITKKLSEAMMMEKQLQEDINKLEKAQKLEIAKSENRSKNLKFLEDKSQDMKIRIKDAEKQLIATGMDQSLTHEALVDFSE